MLWASFPPLDWGPLGWIALVPLLLLVRPAQRPPRAILATYVTAFVSQLFIVQWLRYGDPSMYLAMFALRGLFRCYFPAFLLLCRGAVHRLRVPLVIAAPTIWVGLEYLRAYLFTGGSWYYLGHTQYRLIELIQISDLVGAYGVSFVVMSAAAALAGIVPASWLSPAAGFRSNTATERGVGSHARCGRRTQAVVAEPIRSTGVRFARRAGGCLFCAAGGGPASSTVMSAAARPNFTKVRGSH